MISIIDNATVSMLRMALDAAGMRQQAIAQNIANVNTPGYQRVSVSFESKMVALAESSARGAPPSLADLSNYRPAFEYARGSSEPVALDQELVQMSETVLHQRALLKALNHKLELIGLAINEGKR